MSTSMTPLEAEAVLLVRSGLTAAQAAFSTSLDAERVAALVARADANRAARPVPATVPATVTTPVTRAIPKPPPVLPAAAAAPAPKPAPTPARSTMPTEPPPPRIAPKQIDGADLDTIDDLVEWAEDTDLSRAATLAARIRTCAGELREMRRRHERTAAARDKVAALERALAEAREELRAVGTGKPAAAAAMAVATPAKPTGAGRAGIRAWAAANGFEGCERGRLPQRVVDAYDAAHA